MGKIRAIAELMHNGKTYLWQSGWFDDEQTAEADLDRTLQQSQKEIPAGIYHKVLVYFEKERRAV